jgi:hypothetical protein
VIRVFFCFGFRRGTLIASKTRYAPLRMFGQECVATTCAMDNMNTFIPDM